MINETDIEALDPDFSGWLNEIEVFSTRSERLYEDFLEVKRLSKLRMWLHAAYRAGYNKAIDDEKDT